MEEAIRPLTHSLRYQPISSLDSSLVHLPCNSFFSYTNLVISTYSSFCLLIDSFSRMSFLFSPSSSSIIRSDIGSVISFLCCLEISLFSPLTILRIHQFRRQLSQFALQLQNFRFQIFVPYDISHSDQYTNAPYFVCSIHFELSSTCFVAA